MVTKRETGIAIKEITVVRQLSRKRKRTMLTNKAPSSKVFFRLSIEAWIKSDCRNIWVFISTPLDWDHFRAAVRYSERNPVRARIVLRAEEYRWSSARSHVFGEKDPLLSREALFGLDEEVGDWSAWLNDDDDIEEIDRLRDSTKTGRPCGSASFLETVETRTGRNFTKKKRGPKRRAKPEKWGALNKICWKELV